MNPFLKGLFAAAASSAVAVAQHQAGKQVSKKKAQGCTPCAAHAFVNQMRAKSQVKR